MTRSTMYQHAPHALLLAGAALGFSLTVDAGQDIHAPSEVVQAHVEAEPVLEHYRPYMDAQGNTRSIGEIIRQVRARMNRLEQTQPDSADDQTIQPTPLESLITEPEHRRMVRHQDVAALPKARTSHTQTPEYVVVASPLAWQSPEALAEREYTVLGFGQVGEEQSEPTITDVRTAAPKVSSTDPSVAWTGDTEFGSPLVTPAVPTVDIAVTPLPSASDAPVASIITRQTASMPAPTPLASQTIVPTTASESERVVAQNTSQPQTSDNTRPYKVGSLTQNMFTSKALPANETPAPDKGNRTVEAENNWSDKKLVATRPYIEKNTPSVAPEIKTTPKAQNRPTFPSAPKQVASVIPHHDDHDDQPSATPTKTTDKPGNPLLVYIDEYDKIGSDRFSAIDNALSRINQAVKKADLDVELKITTDIRSDYNIRFAENDGKNMGNKLGLAEFAVTEDSHGNEFFLGETNSNQGGKAQVSINNAFKWFSGDNADDIDDDEYDYQTAVEHEFLHLLGLDDDFDNLDSVSHGLLSPGEVRRELHDREIHTLTDIFSNANPWQSSYNPTSWTSSFNSNRWGNTRYKAKALTAAVPEPATLGLIGLGLLVGATRRCTRS